MIDTIEVNFDPTRVDIVVPAGGRVIANGVPHLYVAGGTFTVELSATTDLIERGKRKAVLNEAIRALKRLRRASD